MDSRIRAILGPEADDLLDHQCRTISRDVLHLPGPAFVDEVVSLTDRSPRVLRNLQAVFDHGRLAGTGYLSILPVDQGIEHSAGSAFAPNPVYFDPENIVKLAVEGQCNAVASTLGVLGAVSRKYAHRIPFLVKINHNELLSYPNTYDQRLFGSVGQALIWARWRWGRPSTTVRRSPGGRSRRSPPPSSRRMNWACSPSCGRT